MKRWMLIKCWMLLLVACLWGCDGNEAASRPDSYPASPKSDAVSANDDSQQPVGGQSRKAVD